MGQEWKEKSRPARLERRYEFESYDQLSNFLEVAARLSDREGLYPNIGFGRGYVNFTIHADEGSDVLNDSQREFASQLEEIRNSEAYVQA